MRSVEHQIPGARGIVVIASGLCIAEALFLYVFLFPLIVPVLLALIIVAAIVTVLASLRDDRDRQWPDLLGVRMLVVMGAAFYEGGWLVIADLTLNGNMPNVYAAAFIIVFGILAILWWRSCIMFAKGSPLQNAKPRILGLVLLTLLLIVPHAYYLFFIRT